MDLSNWRQSWFLEGDSELTQVSQNKTIITSPGSATFMTHGNGRASEGNKVANSTKFFTPFGEYRIQTTSPTDDITDRGYTGHKHNDDIGLIYMNARYYVPEIGRFASADTIIPDQANPQAFNRFSYVRNNPLNLIDPSGHQYENLEGGCITGGEAECLEIVSEGSKADEWANNGGKEEYEAIKAMEAQTEQLLYNINHIGNTIFNGISTLERGIERIYFNVYIRPTGLTWEEYLAQQYSEYRILDPLVTPPNFGSFAFSYLDDVGIFSYVDDLGQLRTSTYIVNNTRMASHLTGSFGAGKSQFLSYVDAESIALSAAHYADDYALWVKVGDAWQAKVFITNGPVGVLGRSGVLTNWVTVTRTRSNFIHAWPSSPPLP